MVVVGHSLVDGEDVVVRQALLFGNVGDHVLPEAVHPQFQPEAHDVLDFLPDFGVIHIQVGLLDGKQVEVVFSPDFIVSPGLALKIGVPVIGELPVFARRTPDVVIGIRLNPAAAFLEPFVLITGVVHDQVHDYLHTSGMGTIQHLTECLHAAEFRGNVPIIGDVVAAVRPRRGVDGGKPDAVAAQAFDVVQLFQHTPQIAHSVAIAVAKRAAPNLIKYHVLIPAASFHDSSLLTMSIAFFARVSKKQLTARRGFFILMKRILSLRGAQRRGNPFPQRCNFRAFPCNRTVKGETDCRTSVRAGSQ